MIGTDRAMTVTKDTADTSALGTVTHYNGIIFGDLIAKQADCEGALAIGGDVQFGHTGFGYDVGAAAGPHDTVYVGKYENPDGYPSLLLAGRISGESTSATVTSGRIVMSLGNKEHYQQNTFQFDNPGNIDFIEDGIMNAFFSNAKKQVLDAAALLSNCHKELIGLSEFCKNDEIDDLAKHENTAIETDDRMLVFNINCREDEAVTIGEIMFSNAIDDYDVIVINLPATRIDFTGGCVHYQKQMLDTSCPRAYECNKLLKDLAGKIIINLPNAREINIKNYGVVGSIIAPNARVTTLGGSINGMLIADHLLQQEGFELHAFGLGLGEKLWKIKPKIPLGKVELLKLDSNNNNKALEGAIFTLHQKNIETGQYHEIGTGYRTAHNGILTIEDLELGEYKLIEIKAPPGYRLPDEVALEFKIELNEEGEIIQMDTIYIYNTLIKGNVLFLKADAEDSTLMLDGAVFELHKYNSTTELYELILTGLTTSDDGRLLLEDLVPARYKLVEIQAPPGYYLSEENETLFTISTDESGEIIDIEAIYILNHKLGSIRIIKLDSNDHEVTLSGAIFDLHKLNSETKEYTVKITGLTTIEDGSIVIENLEPGKYKLVETIPPKGYRIDEAETFFTIE